MLWVQEVPGSIPGGALDFFSPLLPCFVCARRCPRLFFAVVAPLRARESPVFSVFDFCAPPPWVRGGGCHLRPSPVARAAAGSGASCMQYRISEDSPPGRFRTLRLFQDQPGQNRSIPRDTSRTQFDPGSVAAVTAGSFLSAPFGSFRLLSALGVRVRRGLRARAPRPALADAILASMVSGAWRTGFTWTTTFVQRFKRQPAWGQRVGPGRLQRCGGEWPEFRVTVSEFCSKNSH